MNSIPYGLWFNAAISLCGNILFVLPRFEIRNNQLFLDFESLWVADAVDYAQVYIVNINFDCDLGKFNKSDYLYTPENGEKFLSCPITFCRFDPLWKPPDFQRLREYRENLHGQ
jgi:hypothetical protein